MPIAVHGHSRRQRICRADKPFSERQAIGNLWLDARRGGSLAFRSLSALQKTYRELRATAKTAYLAARRPRKR